MGFSQIDFCSGATASSHLTVGVSFTEPIVSITVCGIDCDLPWQQFDASIDIGVEDGQFSQVGNWLAAAYGQDQAPSVFLSRQHSQSADGISICALIK